MQKKTVSLPKTKENFLKQRTRRSSRDDPEVLMPKNIFPLMNHDEAFLKKIKEKDMKKDKYFSPAPRLQSFLTNEKMRYTNSLLASPVTRSIQKKSDEQRRYLQSQENTKAIKSDLLNSGIKFHNQSIPDIINAYQMDGSKSIVNEGSFIKESPSPKRQVFVTSLKVKSITKAKKILDY